MKNKSKNSDIITFQEIFSYRSLWMFFAIVWVMFCLYENTKSPVSLIEIVANIFPISWDLYGSGVVKQSTTSYLISLMVVLLLAGMIYGIDVFVKKISDNIHL